MEFQELRGNDGERGDIDKEQEGTERNPYWPLNGPSFLRVGENSFDVGLPVPPYVACRLRAQILRRGWQAEIPKNCEQGSQ